MLILVFTTMLAIGSVHYLLMRQLQFDVRVSAQQTLMYLEQKGRIDDRVFRGQNILPFVYLIVYDVNGRPLLDNIPRYEPVADLDIWRIKSMNKVSGELMSFDSVETEDNLTYHYLQRWVAPSGDIYFLEFVRETRREKYFIKLLIRQIAVTILAGLGIAVLTGLFVTNKVLRPLQQMKEPLRRIEVNEMGYRVPVPKVQDEQRELAVTINRALDRIEKGVMQQTQFVSDASHELRTPITVISGYTDLLIRWGAEDKETLTESLHAIQAETEYMRQLIEHLLFIARASAGEITVSLRPLNTEEVIYEIWQSAKIMDKNIHRIELTANEPARILADEAMFKQVIRIFLENATKYTPEGKSIYLSSVIMGGELEVSIRDEGIGISDPDLDNIFTRFYRVDSSRTKDTGGTGLGLSIAKDILSLHQARVKVDSELGEGSIFKMYFPLVMEENTSVCEGNAASDEFAEITDSDIDEEKNNDATDERTNRD